MTWLHPWALLGIAGVALPVLIHLLGRGHAAVQRFPSLRFIEPSRLLPTRRTRIHDPLLLAIRAAIVALAAGALAAPLVLTRGRAAALDPGVARAIIVDTGASMRRATSAGTAAVVVARDSARVLERGAEATIVIETAAPRAAMAPAAAWLAAAHWRGELVIISDFQAGSLDSADIAEIPAAAGVALARIPVRAVVQPDSAISGRTLSIATSRGDTAEWRMANGSPALSTEMAGLVELLAADDEADAVAATRAAAATRPVRLPLDTTRRMTIVFPRAPRRRELLAGLKTPRDPWVVSMLARLAGDSMPVTAFGMASVDGRERVVLFTDAAPGTVGAARLAAAANAAASIASAPSELDPASIDDAALARWQRPAGAAVEPARPDADGPSDGRWLWAAALALLGVETIARRRRGAAIRAEEAPARAA